MPKDSKEETIIREYITVCDKWNVNGKVPGVGIVGHVINEPTKAKRWRKFRAAHPGDGVEFIDERQMRTSTRIETISGVRK